MNGYLTVAQVADDLGFSTRTVLRWVADGDLPAIRTPGGRLRIPQSAYVAWQADRAIAAPGRMLSPVPNEHGGVR